MFNVTPGSAETMLRTDKEGIISTLLEAGCLILRPPAAACVRDSTHRSPRTRSVSLPVPPTSRDAWAKKALQVYLGSPATVAASALEGKIADPANIFKE